ncbi:MAG: PKD domain-containing protein [Cytophagales bacterium]|nr:PKD domain-containing protein [Cytophagales bacterium]
MAKRILLKFIFLSSCITLSFGQTANFSARDASGCSPLVTFFDGTSSTGAEPLTYSWDFGNGNQISGNDATPGASYSTPGIYTVTLVVEDANGSQSAPATTTITVFEGPAASFTIPAGSSGCSPVTVNLADNSSPGSAPITQYLWTFGDGTSSADQNPVKNYSIEGIYDINLIVQDANGCQDDFEVVEAITAVTPPDVDFMANRTTSCENTLDVSFTDATTYSTLPGLSYNYFWDFGDGTTSTQRNPIKTYTAGFYDVSFTVTNADFGCTETVTRQQFIAVGQPRAAFDVILQEGCDVFDAQLSITSPLEPSYRFTWVYGDGNSESGTQNSPGLINQTYQYAQGGNYTIQLIVEDTTTTGCSTTVQENITFSNTFNFDFQADVRASCSVPITTQFTYSGDVPVSYDWDFGNGQTSTGPNPQITFNQEGRFTVSLTVTDANGCVRTLTRDEFIQVGQVQAFFETTGDDVQLVPEFFNGDLALIAGGCTDEAVSFTDQSTSPTQIVSWTWDYGDMSPVEVTMDGTVPDHLYAEGTFSPSLTILTDDGCTDTYQCNECVIRGDRPDAQVDITADPESCCGYEGFFDNLTDTATIDFIWYTVSTGDFLGYERTAAGWVDGGAPLATDGDWDFGTTVPVPRCGGQVDMALYTYNNGCYDSTTVLNWQEGWLPYGSGGPQLQEVCVSNWAPGRVLDFNDPAFANIDWQWPGDGAVDSLRLRWDVTGGNTQCGFVIDTTYNVTEHGFLIQDENCDNPAQLVNRRTLIADSMRANNMFPIVTIPNCFQPNTATNDGYVFSITVWDLTSPRQCECTTSGETFFVTVFEPTAQVNPSTTQGCAPLMVDLDPTLMGTATGATWTIFSANDTVTVSGLDPPPFTLDEPGDYRYSVELSTNDCSYDSVYADVIRVFGVDADFEIDPQSVCFTNTLTQQEITFTDQTTAFTQVVGRTWDFGNGNIVNGNDSIVSETYTVSDVPSLALQPLGIQVTLEVEDDQGCVSQHDETLFLRRPEPAFSTQLNAGCVNELTFSISSSSGVGPFDGTYHVRQLVNGDTTEVDQLDFRNSDDANITLENGDYLVNMEISADDIASCPVSTRDTLIRLDTPTLVPGFSTPNPLFTCTPAIVQLNDESVSQQGFSIVAWDWQLFHSSLGAVGQANVQNPQEIITERGYVSVLLQVEDDQGCRKEIRQDSLIFIDELNGVLSLPVDSVCVGVPFEYSVDSTNADRVIWDFGDGIVREGQVVMHTYQQTGTRIPSIILRDGGGLCSESINSTLEVVGPPEVDLGGDRAICDGESLVLTSGFGDGFIFDWNTGLQTSSIEVTEGGQYWLDVADTVIGCVNSDTVRVTLNPVPSVTLAPVEIVCRGEDIELFSEVSSDVVALQWLVDGVAMGDQSTLGLTLQNNANIRLQVTSANGCTNYDTLLAQAVPEPEFTLPNLGVCPGDSTVFEEIPFDFDYPEQSYAWFNSDGELLSESSEPRIAFSEEGVYTLLFSSGTCSGQDSLNVTFDPLPDNTVNNDLAVFCDEEGPARLVVAEDFTVEWIDPVQSDEQELLVQDPGIYAFLITNEFGCTVPDSIVAESRCPPRVFVPDAFSPNGDNENEFFEVFPNNVGDFELVIYNRWGEVIFRTTTVEEFWDGNYKGQLMPSGVYPWTIRYTGNNIDYLEAQNLNGRVTLIR